MEKIENQTFDQERSLYGINDTNVVSCYFGNSDIAESPLKECSYLIIDNCKFDLRYPCWHLLNSSVKSCVFNEPSRASFWYDKHFSIENSEINSVKALRECEHFYIQGLKAKSPEFGWNIHTGKIENTSLEGEYALKGSHDVVLTNFTLNGKYSFQYTKNIVVKSSKLDTKDAFWHSKNVVVENCIIKGEYIGWYSENLTLVNCKIEGTQPFCYCKGLKLDNCELINADLAFEYSSVKATLKGHIVSIKNPYKGFIKVDTVGELIFKDSKMPNKCKIFVGGNRVSK